MLKMELCAQKHPCMWPNSKPYYPSSLGEVRRKESRAGSLLINRSIALIISSSFSNSETLGHCLSPNINQFIFFLNLYFFQERKMCRKLGIFCLCKEQDLQEPPLQVPLPPASTSMSHSSSFNLREEYARTFRTESYTNFLAGVLDITLAHGAGLRPHQPFISSSPSFRLVADYLLDPDQPTVSRLLSPLPSSSLLSFLPKFFSITADSSLVCSLLLSDLHHLRLSYRSILKSLYLSFPMPSFPSFSRLHDIQSASAILLSHLELASAKGRTKLRLLMTFTKCSPAIMGQLDAAAKGTYILNRDLDTISRLVARVEDEAEHVAAMQRLCGQGKAEVRRRMAAEVERQMRRNDEGFRQQLDELEEHLYLCLMTINKARSLVMKEVEVVTGENGRSGHGQ